ncbi:MAG: hypothetical protein JW706_10275 [Opitutales bacterium]|nr:hypothetical protein [Opitutales bacterium]
MEKPAVFLYMAGILGMAILYVEMGLRRLMLIPYADRNILDGAGVASMSPGVHWMQAVNSMFRFDLVSGIDKDES